MIALLAEAAPVVSQGLSPEAVGAIIGSIIIALLGAGVLGKKISDGTKITLTNRPLDVALREQLVTRAECLACKTDAKSELREMKALYEKAIALMLERDERIHNRITEIDNAGAERRRAIYDRLEKNDRMIVAIDARTDVSKSIGKAAAAIMALANKNSN